MKEIDKSGRFRSPRILVTLLFVTFSVYILAQGLLAVFAAIDVIDTTSRLGQTPIQTTQHSLPIMSSIIPERDQPFLTASFFSWLCCAALFLLWTYRISKNLQYFNIPDLKLKPRWAVGWFFIPVANIFLPHDVFLQIWRGSIPHSAVNRPNEQLVVYWWWGFIAQGIAQFGSLKTILTAKTPPEITTAAIANFASCALSATIAILTLVIITKIHRMQSEKIKEIRSQF